MSKRILTIVGARPQFIKASAVSLAISRQHELEEVLLQTGQHFDSNMSSIFFDELGVPEPRYQLNINGGSHGKMTGKMLEEIEKVLLREKPDEVLVYGDTNSTLAGALAAAKLNIPVAHVEAGLRSFDRSMPEEINRILADQISTMLFCPTEVAVRNLRDEGIADNTQKTVRKVGDVMKDAAMVFGPKARRPSEIGALKNFILATFHRAENTDSRIKLEQIVLALNELNQSYPVILPLHPRTRAAINRIGLKLNVNVARPVGYLEMLWLLKNCSIVVTDSGGVQKEAFFHGKQCVTMRESTEWTELIDLNVNTLVGADRIKIVAAVNDRIRQSVQDEGDLYGGGTAASVIARELAN